MPELSPRAFPGPRFPGRRAERNRSRASRRSRFARVRLGALLAALILSGAGLSGAQTGQVIGVAEAEQRLDGARVAYADALATLAEAEQRYRRVADEAVVFESDLRRLDRSSLDTVMAYEQTLSRARDLAVSAYVRGGAHSDLESYLDADAATDVVLRMHLVAGRVDQAQEAASVLRTQRILVDREAEQVAVALAAAAAELADADAGLERARRGEQQAYTAVLEAIDALAGAEGAEAAARAAREAEAQRAATATRPTATTTGSSGGGGSGSPTTQPFEPPGVVDDGQADAWAKLRDCESGGDYTAVSAGGLYRGAYQFSQPTWESVGGVGDPAAASPAEQDYRARLLYERSGAGQWPLCGRYLR